MNSRIMMRRLNKRNLWLLLLPFLLAGCQSYKKVPYFQNVEVVNEVEQQEKLYDAKIMPKDLLTIVVSCTNPELAIPFNLTVASNAGIAVSTSSYVTTQPVLQPYLVDNEGNINFPVLVYGLRDNVKLIREDANGKQQIVTLDLNKAETILSPYYWLQQNDIIYVTPNKAKARNSDVGNSTSLWFSATSILVSIVSLLVNILK